MIVFSLGDFFIVWTVICPVCPLSFLYCLDYCSSCSSSELCIRLDYCSSCLSSELSVSSGLLLVLLILSVFSVVWTIVRPACHLSFPCQLFWTIVCLTRPLRLLCHLYWTIVCSGRPPSFLCNPACTVKILYGFYSTLSNQK